MSSQPISMAKAFSVELGARIHDGLGVIGNFGTDTATTSSKRSSSGSSTRGPCFVGATSAGLIVVHDPNEHDLSRSVRHHNVNRPLTSLATVTFGGESAASASPEKQSLLLGSPASLLVYDIYNNADVFYKDVADGVNTVAAGTIYRAAAAGGGAAAAAVPVQVALVGGNGSVQGFNGEGQESWWTVAGDNVGAVAVLPTSDKSSVIAVGTDDFEIRAYQGDQLATQVTETDKITRLVPVPKPSNSVNNSNIPAQLAYTLGNGTIGVYDFSAGQQPSQMTRRWRYKSKNHPTSIAFGDVNFDGVTEMLVGWSNGRFEVRASGTDGRSGEVIFKETLAAPVAAVAAADYRRTQRDVPVVATNAGDLVGFVPVEGAADSIIAQSQQLQQLMEQKAALEHELAAAMKQTAELETQLASAQPEPVAASVAGSTGGASPKTQQQQQQQQAAAAAVAAAAAAASAQPAPEMVDVRASLIPSAERKRLELTVSVTGAGSAVQSVAVHADVVFGAHDTVFLANPVPGSNSMTLNLNTVKDLQSELRVVVTLSRPNMNISGAGGAASSTSAQAAGSRQFFEVRRFNIKLPKFVMYCPLRSAPTDELMPKGCVSARISERAGRLVMWAQSTFIGFGKIGGFQPATATAAATSATDTTESSSSGGGGVAFEAWFQSMRQPNHKIIGIVVQNDGALKVICEDMEIAGDFLQDLCSYMSVAELSSTAVFPVEYARCAETLDRVESMNQARLKLAAEMADVTQLVKALVVKIEDARMLGDVKTVRKTLDSLYEVNNELLGEHLKRSTNHAELLSAMKYVNFMVQKAARLRVGEAKNRIVAVCRNAVKDEKMSNLVSLFEKDTM